MAKVMLINVTHAEESRVAIVADGTLVSFEIESCNREHLKGNIYKGIVQRVQPGLEAAFVDIGAERNAFLPLDEVCFRHLPQPVRPATNGEKRRPRIQDLLKPGDEILVQIIKEQFGSKPPTLSTFYSLPGRFLVLLPGSDDAGISRRIEGADRVRVRELIEKLHPPQGFGIIVRTVVSFDPGLSDLQRDLTYLLRLWESIQQAAAQKRAPALVYREHDLVLRNIRDYFTPDIDEIYVDNEEVFERARQFLRDVMPEKEGALRLYQGDKPIFSFFDIEAQIESIFKRRVPLRSGGYIVIDGTEALTAIDVNSGRSIRGANQEETAFQTNLEAAVEIARQLRLRDLGGLIVIDFIDMRNPQHITEVEKALRTAMFEDKARHEVGRISHFGLLEVSRQRLRPAATATTYVSCPMCDGYGLVRTTESAALVALRKVHNRVAQGDVGSARVALPPEVAMYLLNQKREDLAQLERRYSTKIVVVPKSDLMPHQCEIEVKPRRELPSAETSPMLRAGGVAVESGHQRVEGAVLSNEVKFAAIEMPPPAAPGDGGGANGQAVAEGTGAADPGKQAKRRRRRGRKRGKGRLAAAALQEALSALAAQVSGTSIDAGEHDERPGALRLGESPADQLEASAGKEAFEALDLASNEGVAASVGVVMEEPELEGSGPAKIEVGQTQTAEIEPDTGRPHSVSPTEPSPEAHDVLNEGVIGNTAPESVEHEGRGGELKTRSPRRTRKTASSGSRRGRAEQAEGSEKRSRLSRKASKTPGRGSRVNRSGEATRQKGRAASTKGSGGADKRSTGSRKRKQRAEETLAGEPPTQG